MIHHLRAAGSSLVLDARGSRLPAIVHWGADLGDLDERGLTALADSAVPAVGPSSIDLPLRVSVLPGLAEGWSGRPALQGFWSATGRAIGALEVREVERDGLLLRVTSDDGSDGAVVVTEVELTEHGVLRIRHRLRNDSRDRLELAALDAVLPIPDRAREVLDFTGLWTHERRPQRTALGLGSWSRQTRHGRPGHDDPFLTVAGTAGFAFRSGEVWAAHLAWSGDKSVHVERQPLGPAVIALGELLAPGEIRLAPGESYTTPWVVGAWSREGLDGLSARLHPYVRSRSTVRGPRPVVLNTWEAVYFDHDLDVLGRLVEAAAQVGVERFVLDDGWFTGRRDDRRALGDWTVDPTVWPQGLHPLVDLVRSHGMDFGLWVEPEMVSPDSALARAHPEWVLGEPSAPTWRFQRTLDLDHPEAYAYVRDRLVALVREYPIAYLKWDHNRDLLEPVAHRQTMALYRLIDELRVAAPGLEIESCASGGARIDLGILERVDRVWTSDTNDPLERQQIQRWTGILVPPEYLGSHLGAPRAHTTGRSSDLSFRAATALFGSAGIEWDLLAADDEQRARIASWTAAYRERRAALHTGTVVRADLCDPALLLHGVVAPDRSSALFAYVALAAAEHALPAPVRLVGLDQDRVYRVRPWTLVDRPAVIQDVAPPWVLEGGVTLPGRVLAEVGLPMPLLLPQQALLLEVDAVG
ncbi:alpha-galactosidase [Actinotalea sp.]|uniref:alpha-galactosidase n=1 Tax=Actinotalea sp. TaxID=1872145 RepID=UPI0035656242